MLKTGMKNEVLPVRFRRNRLRGSMHFSRTGCITFIVSAIDAEVFPAMQGAIAGSIATNVLDGDSFYDQDTQEWE